MQENYHQESCLKTEDSHKVKRKRCTKKEVAEIVGISAQTISTYYTQYKNSRLMFLKSRVLDDQKVCKRLSDEQNQKSLEC